MPSLGSFQDALAAAVQLKTALVKAKPGRQEWEQAPPFMRCTASAVDIVQQARDSCNFSLQYSTAFQLKDQGNELINKDPAAALQRYTEALSVFLWFDRGRDRTAEEVPLVCAADALQGAERDQAHHLLAVSFSNAAVCLLQLGMAADASYACSKALKYDPYNVKAYYRRAMAQRASGSTAGLETAVADLAAANQLEPANSQVRLALAAVQHELREHRRQERDMYGNIFQRGGALYGDHDGAAAAAPAAATAAAAGTTPTAPAMRRRRRPQGAAADGGGDDGREGEGQAAAASPDDVGLGGGGGGGGALGEEAAGAEEEEEETVLFRELRARKAAAARASREADAVVVRMRAALASRRTRRMAAALDAERAAVRPGGPAGAGRFPWWAVPWWAYALIGLHLVYRLIKVWRVPATPTGGGSGGTTLQEAVAAAAAGLLGQQGGHLEL